MGKFVPFGKEKDMKQGKGKELAPPFPPAKKKVMKKSGRKK